MDNELELINRMKTSQEKSDALAAYIIKHPDDKDALFMQTYNLEDAGKHIKAKAAYEELLNKFPDHVDGHYNFGLLLKNFFEDYKNAKDHFAAVTNLDPSNEEAHYKLAYIEHVNFANAEEATLHYEKAIAINANLDYVHNSFAILLSNDFSNANKAKEHYEKAIALNQNNARAHFNYAHHLQNNFLYSSENIADCHNDPELIAPMMSYHVRAKNHYIIATSLEPTLIHPWFEETFRINRNDSKTMSLATNLA